jgi:predicted membrane-bound spermidine synthase
MDQQSTTTATNSWKTLAIIALVLGILALLFSFIPCLGMYAIFPGIIGLVMAVISIVMAGKVNAPKGMAIAALACSLVGSAIAGYQYSKLKEVIEDPKLKQGLEDLKNSLDTLKDIKLDTTNLKP